MSLWEGSALVATEMAPEGSADDGKKEATGVLLIALPEFF